MTKDVIAWAREAYPDGEPNWLPTCDAGKKLHEAEAAFISAALSAAKAVSEPKLGAAVGELASPEYDQLRAKVQPTAMPFVPWEMLRSRTVQPQAQGEAVIWQFRNIVNGEPATDWQECKPRNPYMNTVQDTINELLAYRYNGKPSYEVRGLYAHPQASELAEALTDQHLQAAILCREAGHVSVSLVQRKLKTGYVPAQDICQKIIDAGLVAGLTIAPSLKTPAAPEATK